jgi:hypothetical protein
MKTKDEALREFALMQQDLHPESLRALMAASEAARADGSAGDTGYTIRASGGRLELVRDGHVIQSFREPN